MAKRNSKARLSDFEKDAALEMADARIEKAILVLGFLDEYIEGDTQDIVKQSVDLAVELARMAQKELRRAA